MKRLLPAISALALILAACQAAPTPVPLTEPDYDYYEQKPDVEPSLTPPLQTYPELENYVHMTVTNVTPTYATVTIQNDSDLPLTTGWSYTLEAYVNGQWLHVPMMELEIPIAFPSTYKQISPHSSVSFNKDLSIFPLSRGELYRVRKDVRINTWLIEFMADDEYVYDIDIWQIDELIDDADALQADEQIGDVEPVAIEPAADVELIDDIETSQTDELVGNFPELAPNPPPRAHVDTTQHEIVAEFVWNR